MTGDPESAEGMGREGDGRTSPYTSLSDEILQYMALGEVLLLGDFNARTQSLQCDRYDFEDPIQLRTLDEEDTGA